jgi:hypothetical protein
MTYAPPPDKVDIENRLLIAGYHPNVAYDAAQSAGVEDALNGDVPDDTIIRTALRIADKLVASNRPRYAQPVGE